MSTKDGKQNVSNQLRQLREYCRKQGWKIVAEYIDKKSGGTSERAAFQGLFNDAHQRKFDLVLFWSLDRFSREGVVKTLNHLQRLDDSGVKWKSYTQEYLTSMGPFGPAIVGLMAALAAQERQILSERTRAGLERAKANGKTLGRPRKIFDRSKVIEARRRGDSLGKIAKAHGISRTHVLRVCREAEAA